MNIFEKVRKDIPLTEKVVYFDNAATSLTPVPVVEAVTKYYLEYKGNVHRGVHSLSEKASQAYDEARQKVAHFINASPEEIVFVQNTTEALNYVALGLHFEKGDIIVTTELEHHSNFLPFFRLQNKGVTVKVIEAARDGTLKDQLEKIERATLVTCSYVSNALGTVLPVKQISSAAKDAGALFCVDAAQAVGHMVVDVKELTCDFLAFSGHKGPLGPTGIGVLYIKKEVQPMVEPVFLGGGMVKDVSKSQYTTVNPPEKYEAGTPNIAGAVGLAAAIEYVTAIGIPKIQEQEKKLTHYTLDELSLSDKVVWYGPYTPHAGVISFNVQGINCHDIAAILDSHSIMVRSGHHCALPLMKKLGIDGTVRCSYHCYNTIEEVERMIFILREISKTLV
jgi:cysteine desulfurase/selenocysteine lyase